MISCYSVNAMLILEHLLDISSVSIVALMSHGQVHRAICNLICHHISPDLPGAQYWLPVHLVCAQYKTLISKIAN